MTIYVTVKSSSISKELKKISVAKTFNRERQRFADRFSGYIKSILEDNDHSTMIIHSVSQDVQMFERKYKSIHSFTDIWVIFWTKRNLQSKHIDFDKLCHQLDYIVTKLNIKEDYL